MKNPIKFTALHRSLHWAMALTLPALFITGFLRMYWMGKSAVGNALMHNNFEVTQEQIKSVRKFLIAPMWKWHVVFAHIIVAAFLIRMGYMIAKGIRFPNPFKASKSIHEKIEGFTYLYFYFFLFISIITGASIRNGFFLQWKHEIEFIHKLGLYWFSIFIFLHLAGIVHAEISNKKGITSKMVGGE